MALQTRNKTRSATRIPDKLVDPSLRRCSQNEIGRLHVVFPELDFLATEAAGGLLSCTNSFIFIAFLIPTRLTCSP
jgi:hypothetical protein